MLKTRVLTAAVLLLGLLAALFGLPGAGWTAFAAALLALAAREWAELSRIGDKTRCLAYAILLAGGGLALLWLPEPGHFSRLLYALSGAFWIVVAPLWLWRRPQMPGTGIMLAVGAAVLLPLFVAVVELREASPALLLLLMALVWLSDSVAFFIGSRFGRHKLAPAISPGKSWEGAWGALIAVALYGIGWNSLPGSVEWAPGIGLGPSGAMAAAVMVLVLLAIAGMIGDLFESQMKRQAGVKDSGQLLPGHGGVLDRIDALIPVLPLAAWALLP